MKRLNLLTLVIITVSLSILGSIFIVALSFTKKTTNSLLPIKLTNTNNSKINNEITNNVVSCYDALAYDKEDYFSPYAAINRPVVILSAITKNKSDTVLQRYIYDGYRWKSATSSSNCDESSGDMSCNELTTTYSEAKDLVIAGGWLYKTANGTVKSIVCKGDLRLFNREVKSFGVKTITLFKQPIDFQTIQGSYPYIGLAMMQNLNGNNNGYTPTDKAIWGWKVQETGWTSNSCEGMYNSNAWNCHDFQQLPMYASVQGGCSTKLPNQFTYFLFPAEFKSNEGEGAYANFDFNNMVLYSRDSQRSCPGNPPPLTSSFLKSENYLFNKPIKKVLPSIEPIIPKPNN